MRQASWIAFLLLTVGLLSYEAAIDAAPDPGTESIAIEQGEKPQANPEGTGDWPPK
jgi:hypothetical protein